MIEPTIHSIILQDVKPKKILIISDTHSGVFHDVDKVIEFEKPDFILLSGDIIDDKEEKDDWDNILIWLKQLNQKVPVIASLGNHDVKAGLDVLLPKLNDTGIMVLDNNFIKIDDLFIYGYTPELFNSPKHLTNFPVEKDKTIVLCHRPEDFYETELLNESFALTISGHCHGGQWRFFGRGIYAPGQGFFPKYTSGFYFNNKLFITRGLSNKNWPRRINNKSEIVILNIN